MAETDPGDVTRDRVEAALDEQRGVISQRPPAYSAKKRGGERAHVAARQGRALVLEPIEVRVDRLDMTRFEGDHLELDIVCSSGTYIRAIARDLGDALGVGGHLTALRRTAVGAYDVAGAIPLDRLDDADAVEAALIEPLVALNGMATVELSEDDVVEITHGRRIRAVAPAGTVALAAHGRLLGIGLSDGSGTIRPKKVLA